MSDFDKLVEQADQEISRTGTLSASTQTQLQAVASGKQAVHVEYQAVTQWLRERRRRRLQDEDAWWDEEGDEG